MDSLPGYSVIALTVHALMQLETHHGILELTNGLDSLKERCCTNRYICLFTAVFLLRYTRGIANVFGSLRYRPAPVRSNLLYKPADITVLIPTTDVMSTTVHRVLRSILAHPISSIIITTAGPKAKEQTAAFKELFQDSRVLLIHRGGVSRRLQTAHAMEHVDTALIVLQDDHTYWPMSNKFLQSLLVPFEVRSTGAVSVTLDARHRQHGFSWAGFWNFLGMTYLTRRRFEYCATSGIDGGISTLSGRFGVFRTEIYASPDFLAEYLDERVFFGLVGPLNVDDDKFHTRWLIDHDWDIKLQAGPETTMTTELGEWPKFNEQVLRWIRTTFRSNPRQVFHRMSWIRHPYTTFSLLIWVTRMSLIQEGLMLRLLYKVLEIRGSLEYFRLAAIVLYSWVTCMKLIKIYAHFRTHPKDIVYFPGYLLFGYWCTLVKIWACLTWWNASWATEKVCNEVMEAEEAASQETRDADAQVKTSVVMSPAELTRRPELQYSKLCAIL